MNTAGLHTHHYHTSSHSRNLMWCIVTLVCVRAVNEGLCGATGYFFNFPVHLAIKLRLHRNLATLIQVSLPDEEKGIRSTHAPPAPAAAAAATARTHL